MDENRKEWQKPELIVSVRSTPEEAVLLTCKMQIGKAWLQGFADYDCAQNDECDLCSLRKAS